MSSPYATKALTFSTAKPRSARLKFLRGCTPTDASSPCAACSETCGQTVRMNELVDMQWKFGVTASSDDAAQIGSTFLQLKLVLNKGSGLESHYMELTLPQFYGFLQEMEKAKQVIDFLR